MCVIYCCKHKIKKPDLQIRKLLPEKNGTFKSDFVIYGHPSEKYYQKEASLPEY